MSTALALPSPPLVLPERPGAYAWWYFDALSDDGETSLVAIFFVGSVFSPYYARRLARGEEPSPLDHVALNLAIYRRGQRPWWVFSEYDARRLEVTPRGLRIASSWFQRRADGSFAIRIRDTRVAMRTETLGEIRVSPVRGAGTLTHGDVELAGGAHRWRCVVPHARVRATFTSPGLAFEGDGYHDVNAGDEPPARALTRWSWGRAHYGDRTRVFFDTEARDGQRCHLTFDTRSGRAAARLQPRAVKPSMGCWLLPMPDGFDAGDGDRGEPLALEGARPLERAPFYQRFVATFPRPEAGDPVRGIGEHIDFDRFTHPVVGRMIALRLARPDRGDFGLIP